MKPKSFKRWCEDNGRRSRGGDYAEFSRNAADYETYLGFSHKCIREGCEANADGLDGSCVLHSPDYEGADVSPYCGPDCGFLLGLGDCRGDDETS